MVFVALIHAETSAALSGEEGSSYDKNLGDLKAEHDKPNPSTSTIKKLMKATFAGRRAWILNDTPTVSEVISIFPSLKLSSRVSATIFVWRLSFSSCFYTYRFVGS